MGGMVGDEDLVHQECHHRTDDDHNDAGGRADGMNLADEPEVGAEALDGQGDIGILLVVEVYGQGAALGAGR